MQTSETVECPFCGAANTFELDVAVRQQQFTTDCENCCRPFEVRVECEGGEVVSADVV